MSLFDPFSTFCACSCLDLHHKTLKSLTQTVTSDCRWNQLFVFLPCQSLTESHASTRGSDRLWIALLFCMVKATDVTTMTEVRCFTKARGLNLGHELNVYVPSCVCVCGVCVCVCVCSGWAWMESHWSSLIWQLTFFHCYSYNNIYKYSNNYNCINKKKHIFHKKMKTIRKRFENQ